MIEIETSGTPLDDSARKLRAVLKGYKDKKDVLILFSGGSSLAIISRLHPRILSSRTTISVLDERFTFVRNKSNFSVVKHTSFYKEAMANGAEHIDPLPNEDDTVESAGKRFDLALKHWHITHPDGVVVATVGVGADGHTAGIMPMEKDPETFRRLFLDERICALGYEVAPEINPLTKRMTTTLAYFAKHIDHAIIYATGAQKKEALQTMLVEGEEYETTPSKILHKVKHTTLFTDLSLR